MANTSENQASSERKNAGHDPPCYFCKLFRDVGRCLWAVPRQIWCWLRRNSSAINLIVSALIFIAIYFQYEVLDETLVSSNRAWIEPSGISILSGLKPGEDLTYLLTYANIGGAPALNVVMPIVELRTVEPPPNNDWYHPFPGQNPTCKNAKPNKDGLVVYQSKHMKQNHKYWTDAPPPDAEAVRNGRRALIFEGCIGYETFTEEHYSAYCFYLPPTSGTPPDRNSLIHCLKYNNAD